MASWRDCIDSAHVETCFGLSQPAWKAYRVPDGRGGEASAFSMLELGELALLYWLARERWTGAGEIADLGPYAGLTTWCLAAGVRDNRTAPRLARNGRIHSYDLFVDYRDPGVSIFPDYLKLNSANLDALTVCPGDIRALRWSGKPLEIIFLDLAKSYDIHDHVVSEFVSKLTPDGYLVQQDYVYFDQYWLHIFMEIYREFFTLEELVYGATGLFRLKRPLPDLAGWSLKALLTSDEQVELHGRHTRAAPTSIQGVLWCAHAKLLFDLGRVAEARRVLADVDAPVIDEASTGFSLIAASNRRMVSEIINGPG